MSLRFPAILFLALICCFNTAAQQVTDSVDLMVDHLPTDSAKATALLELSAKYRNSNLDQSLAFAKRAKELSEKGHLQSILGNSLMFMGIEYYYMGNYQAAIAAYLDGLRVYESVGDKKGEATILNEIGTFNKKQGDTAQARLNYERAYTLSRELSDSVQMANSMNNLGLVYELNNQDDKAMDFFIRSAEIKEKLDDFYGLAYNYDNIGGNLTKRRRYDEAEQWLKKSIDIRRKLNDQTGLSLSLNNMGELYLLKNELAKARQFFEDALKLTFTIHYPDLRAYIYAMISDTWKKQNEYKKALEFYTKSIQVKDSIFSEKKQKEILDLQTRYETGKKENEILLLREANEIKDFKIRQNATYLAGLILLVIAIFVTAYFWQNRIRLKQRAELETTRATLRESQLEAVISSQEKERRRFAADLHDGLGQMISALRLSLSNDNPAKKIVDQALGLLNDMNGEIRNIAFNLMPQVLVTGGLEDALREFAGRVNRFGDISITITSFEGSTQLSSDYKIALYRICQEWVNNAMKYSSCKHIMIELVQHPDELVIIIEDDGRGFDPKVLLVGDGNGWKNISSRLAMMHGTIDINSRPGHQGTTAVIAAPLTVLHPA